jgi:hypothetical protein
MAPRKRKTRRSCCEAASIRSLVLRYGRRARRKKHTRSEVKSANTRRRNARSSSMSSTHPVSTVRWHRLIISHP